MMYVKLLSASFTTILTIACSEEIVEFVLFVFLNLWITTNFLISSRSPSSETVNKFPLAKNKTLNLSSLNVDRKVLDN